MITPYRKNYKVNLGLKWHTKLIFHCGLLPDYNKLSKCLHQIFKKKMMKDMCKVIDFITWWWLEISSVKICVTIFFKRLFWKFWSQINKNNWTKKKQKQKLLINGTRLTKKKYPNNIKKVYSTKVKPGGGTGGTE